MHDIYKQTEVYFDGYYQFLEFNEDDYEKVYDLISNFLGSRVDYVETSFTTIWRFSTEKIQKATLNLYVDHIELFIDIPTNMSEYQMSIDTLSKPEEVEYLFRHSEFEKKRMKELIRNEDSFKRYSERLKLLKASNSELEEEMHAKLTEHLKSEIETLKKDNQLEEEKLNELKLLEIEKQRQLDLKQKSEQAIRASKNNLNNLPKTNNSLPVGYYYNNKHYERALFNLKSKYGVDAQIEEFMKDQMVHLVGSKDDIRFLAWYVDLYKVKFEGISTIKDYDNPEYVNINFDAYLHNAKSSLPMINAILWSFIALIIIFLLSNSCN